MILLYHETGPPTPRDRPSPFSLAEGIIEMENRLSARRGKFGKETVMKYIRRTLALVLALTLCLALVPGAAAAAGKNAVEKTPLALKDDARTDQPQDPPAAADPTFVFRSATPFTLRTANGSINWDGELAYSCDGRIWALWHGEEIRSGGSNGRQCLYLRGTANRKVSYGEEECWILTGSHIACSGNIEYLLDYKTVLAGDHPQMDALCFNALFLNNTELISAPRLPAMTVAPGAYAYMFYGCTSLKQAPKLPATSLGNSCYYMMFCGCTSLIEAPELPATTIPQSCYSYMFAYCTSLRKAPSVLPAEELQGICYHAMFLNCTSLKKPPQILATSLDFECCSWMFLGCTSLEYAPELPVATLASYCYSGMFYNCISLSCAPELPATTLARGCYFEMFEKCTSLTDAPALPAETVPDTAYARMFDGCTSLVNAPALPAMSLSEYCYSGMFTNCTSLTEAPALRATALKFCCYSCMFQGCTALRSVPALPAYELADGCYYYMFSGCSAIKLSETETEEYTIPYSVPILQDVGDVGIEAVSGMFENTGGTFTGTPEPAAVYYLHTSNSIVY